MVKRGGANIVKGLENDNSDFITKTLKYCNGFGVLSNFVIIFICIIVIGISWKSVRKYKEVEANIISVKNKSASQQCLSNTEKTPGQKKISYCVVNFEYIVKGQTITSSIETTITKEQYVPGTTKTIYYNKNDIRDIKFATIGKGLLLLAVSVMSLTVIATIVRLFFADNTLVKWWIGLQCAKTAADIFD